jgi:isoprenylcysteine carboxyl methyltransferase (ICMT) family protein YpbQ
MYLIIFLIAAFAWRITTVVISARHEKALKLSGGKEYGDSTSLLLAGFHVLFYVSAVVEGLGRDDMADTVSYVGLVMYAVSAVALISVIRSLGPLWTIKLIIAPGHHVVRSGLFRFIRHPNYFVSIIPELVGLALATNAYWTLCIGLPLYAIPLTMRIRQEENVMKSNVLGYI